MLLPHDNGRRLFSSEHIRFILTEHAQIGVAKINCENICFIANIYLFIYLFFICLIMREAVYMLNRPKMLR